MYFYQVLAKFFQICQCHEGQGCIGAECMKDTESVWVEEGSNLSENFKMNRLGSVEHFEY